MKGIVLAAGAGTRLYPVTKATAKPLIPVYDKPMIYYPLSLLMLAGIRDIMIITSEKDSPNFEALLGDGSDYGVDLTYGIQKEPRGIAESLIIAEDFADGEPVALILGDNLLDGKGLEDSLLRAAKRAEKEDRSTIFGFYVEDPRAFGVVGFDENGTPVSLVEKPKDPASNYAVIGVYFYDRRAAEIAKGLSPSARGELEITDVNAEYLAEGKLDLEILDRDAAWFDAGTFSGLAETSDWVRDAQEKSGRLIGCLEEIAYKKGWIDKDRLSVIASHMDKSDYGIYLTSLID